MCNIDPEDSKSITCMLLKLIEGTGHHLSYLSLRIVMVLFCEISAMRWRLSIMA